MAVPGSPEPLSSQHGGTGGCGCLGSSRERALGSPETHLKPLLPPPAQYPGLAGCRGALGGHLGSPHLPCPITQLEGRGMPKGVAAVSGWQRCPALCWVLRAQLLLPTREKGQERGAVPTCLVGTRVGTWAGLSPSSSCGSKGRLLSPSCR